MPLSLPVGRRRPCFRFAVFAIAVLPISFLSAAPEPLTLSAVLQRVAASNPHLQTERFTAETADALIEQAGVTPNPTLDLSVENALGTGSRRGLDAFEATVQATQVIERGGKRQARISRAQAQRNFTAATWDVRRLELFADAAGAFVRLLAAEAYVASADEPLRLAQQTVAAVQARVNAAIASPAEAARARAALASAQADCARARALQAGARAALAAFWGATNPDFVLPPHLLRVPESPPKLAGLQSKILSHPRLRLAAAALDQDRAALDLEQAQAIQDVTVGGGLRFFREGSDAALVAGVSVPLPIRHRNQGNIRAARATLAGTTLEATTVEIELRSALTAAWQDLVAAHVQARTLQEQVLPATAEAFAILQDAYAQGQMPLIDVLDAQRALSAVQRELLDAAVAYTRALVRLDALTDPTFASVDDLLRQP